MGLPSAEVLELELPQDFVETPLSELKAPVFAMLGAILRGKEVIIPRERASIKPGDRLLILTSGEDEEATRALFLRGERPDKADRPR